MARKKQSTEAARAQRNARKAVNSAKGTGEMIKETWSAALTALAAGEAELQRQLTNLMRRNKLTPKDAQAALADLAVRVDRERRKALKQLDARVVEMQGRLHRERQSLSHVVDDAVHGALVAFNIPSRQEVAQLTRKVDELSRKIDGIQKPSGRKAASRKTARRKTVAKAKAPARKRAGSATRRTARRATVSASVTT